MIPVADRGLVIFKVPIYSDGSAGLNGSPCQAICEIFCTSKAMEPRFAIDWRIMQLVVIRNVKFDQSYEHHGLTFHKFKMNPSDPALRYIWLSSPRPNFWQMPVLKPENPRFRCLMAIEVHDHSVVHGIVDKSPGSILGSRWSLSTRNIHTHTTIAGNKLHHWSEMAKEYKNWIRENTQILLVNDNFSHNLGGDFPRMHMLVFHLTRLP